MNGFTVLAQMPGQSIRPQAPAELATKFDNILNLAMYVGIVVIILGVLIAGASMAMSRRDGSSEEATAMALRIGIGAMIVGSATSIVAAFL
ncbi:hypothetical protein BRL53_05180 [Corynebacterium ulcerans]|uniref:TrbC/VirB2 family protein n=1 Tax=Corynebacterium ulcerans TaxID=65058 RepID=UPI000C75ED1E|nr:TrbC/VirB2 family protein [Corynebacterium ulcerans]PLW00127.1 hypothetical protein BRL53_05180 [Corynebacterium ulcerans]